MHFSQLFLSQISSQNVWAECVSSKFFNITRNYLFEDKKIQTILILIKRKKK